MVEDRIRLNSRLTDGAAHPQVEDEALQGQAQVGRQRPQAQLARCVDLAAAVLARVLVVARQVLHLQR